MKTKLPNKLRITLAGVLALVVLSARVHANAIAYSVTVLDGLGGSFGSAAYAINSTGQVAGYSCIPDNTRQHAMRWTGTTMTELGAFGSIESIGYGINDSGQVSGYLHYNGALTYAALWTGTDTTGTPLPQTRSVGTSGTLQSIGRGVNAAGQVAGFLLLAGFVDYNGTHNFYHAGRFTTGLYAEDLGAPGDYNAFGFGINDSGQIAGYSSNHAVRWTGTTAEYLGTFGSSNNFAYGINSSGDVAGSAQTANGSAQHAVRWTGTTPEDLGTLGGTNSFGYGINDSGDVVGMSQITDNATRHAFLYTGGTMYDLFNMLPLDSGVTNLDISTAGSINNSGQIAATGTINGQQRALRLDPITVPEPTSIMLLLSGASLLGLSRRRLQ